MEKVRDGSDGFTVRSGSGRLRVFADGSGHRETVLLLHGGPGVPDYLGPVSAMLKGGYRTLRFDQRGVGESVALDNDYSVDRHIEDIEAIAEQLQTPRFHIFGHSWGGLLAQLYAAAHPERVLSLCLCSPASGTGEVWRRVNREVLRYNRGQATGREWLGMGRDSLLGTIGLDSGYRRVFANVWRFYFSDPRQAPPADAGWLRGIKARAVNGTSKGIRRYDNEAWGEKLAATPFPILVVYGRYDIYGRLP